MNIQIITTNKSLCYDTKVDANQLGLTLVVINNCVSEGGQVLQSVLIFVLVFVVCNSFFPFLKFNEFKVELLLDW